MAAGRKELHKVTWRHGTKTGPGNRTAAMKSRFLAIRIRPANRDIPLNEDRSLPEAWMLAEWPVYEPAPTDYWISDLARRHATENPRQASQDEMEDRTRLPRTQGFEGRSFNDFHRHLTLVTAAQLFITRKRLATPKVQAVDTVFMAS